MEKSRLEICELVYPKNTEISQTHKIEIAH